MIQQVKHPVTGFVLLHGIPAKFNSASHRLKSPAPRMGEHTAWALKKYLGIKAAEIRKLERERVVGLASSSARR